MLLPLCSELTQAAVSPAARQPPSRHRDAVRCAASRAANCCVASPGIVAALQFKTVNNAPLQHCTADGSTTVEHAHFLIICSIFRTSYPACSAKIACACGGNSPRAHRTTH